MSREPVPLLQRTRVGVKERYDCPTTVKDRRSAAIVSERLIFASKNQALYSPKPLTY